MTTTKRVTVIVELVDVVTGRTTWSHTETANGSTGDNPRFHVEDVEANLAVASDHALGVVRGRFGSPPPPPTTEELEDQAAARAAARLRRRNEYHRAEEAQPPVASCSAHIPVQHRDGKPPWCDHCGRTEDGRHEDTLHPFTTDDRETRS